MWWAGSKAIDLYIGTCRVAACDEAQRLMCQPVDGQAAALAQAAHWLNGQPRRTAYRVWLSGSLCRPFMVPPMPGLKAAEWHRALQALAQQRTGIATACCVWVEPAQGGQPQVAVAMAADLGPQLQQIVSKAGGRLRSLRPWWSEALRFDTLRAPGAATLGILDCDALTVFAGPAGCIDHAATVAPLGQADDAHSALARTLVMLGAGGGQRRVLRLDFDRPDAPSTLDIALGTWVMEDA